MSLTPEQTERLRAPFDPDNEIEWRVQRVHKGDKSASLIAYVTARAVMDRLDDVFGVDGYSVEYRTVVLGKHEGFICTITAGNVVKEDISDITDIEALKGGVSGALKRCAVLFGVGRYLYDLGEEFAEVREGRGPRGSISVKLSDGKYGYVLRPKMPGWALPKRNDAVEKQESTSDSIDKSNDHDPEWSSGGNKAFMAKYSARFKSSDGFDYTMLADFLESKGKRRPSQMNKDDREKLLAWLFTKGADEFTKYVNDILSSRS